jgi:hypothetical protein
MVCTTYPVPESACRVPLGIAPCCEDATQKREKIGRIWSLGNFWRWSRKLLGPCHLCDVPAWQRVCVTTLTNGAAFGAIQGMMAGSSRFGLGVPNQNFNGNAVVMGAEQNGDFPPEN